MSTDYERALVTVRQHPSLPLRPDLKTLIIIQQFLQYFSM
jgi:hypothetical protein